MTHTKKRSSVKFSKSVAAFILEVKNNTRQHGFKLTFVDEEYVYGTPGDTTPHVSKMNGYFDYDEDVKELCVAIGKPLPDWIVYLAHEYAHFLQWLDDTTFYDDVDVDDRFDDWLTFKKEYPPEKVWADLSIIRNCELDAERRTIALIKKYKLISGVGDYIKMANAYILSYNIMGLTRGIFFPAPHKVKALWSLLPDTLDLNYEKDHMKYYNQYMQHCNLMGKKDIKNGST